MEYPKLGDRVQVVKSPLRGLRGVVVSVNAEGKTATLKLDAGDVRDGVPFRCLRRCRDSDW